MAEKEVAYVDYIKNRFPQIHISNVKFDLTNGRHNDIVMINDELIFKFARYDWTGAFLANQVKTTGFIREFVDMPLPQMENLDHGVARHELIPGEPLFRNEILLLKDNDQNYIAKQIGTFLRQLHAIPLKLAKTGHLDEVPVDLSRKAVLAEYDDIQRKVYPYCDGYTQECIRQVFAPVLENRDFLEFTPALIHADPTPRRFLCDKGLKKINAAIGFGCAGIGDPAYDMGIVLGSFGETFLKRIGRYYGDLSKLIDRARFYSAFNHLCRVKKTADMITTRDFSTLRFDLEATDSMPVGSKW
jgi:Phosphotransferase enzyme family.